MESTIEERVQTVIEAEMGIERSRITRGAHLQEDLGCDSLDTVEIVMGLEEEFGVEIPDEEAEKLTTVGAVIDYVADALQ